ncbi:MAG TPA: hypothetical protein VNK23_07105 [Candidatus Dormibacteraeota bacterium]|nr:hypothetical protein [Candidatus Dormibacteraeota bacterium]
MALTSKTRALISVAALLCMAAIAIAWYLHGGNKPAAPAPAPHPGTPPSIFSDLPPAAPVIGYADVADLRTLQNTPLAAVLGLAAPGPEEDREYRDFVRDTGFDYTRDLDKVAIAFWPSNLTQPATGIGQNRVLAVADGRFDQQKIEAYALRTGKSFKDGPRTLYDVPGNPPVAFEFLSPTRILIASGQDPVSLLTMGGGSSADAAVQARISRVAGAPIFAVARTSNLPKSFYSNFKNSPQLEQLARSIQEITLAAQPDGQNIHTVVDAQCDSIKNAVYISTLADTFRIIGRAELGDPSVRRQMTKQQAQFLTGLLSHASVSRDSNWIRLTFSVTPAMLGTSQPAIGR